MNCTYKQRILELRTMIDEALLPLINSDYVLWGLPYYINPGDTLIWEGTLSLLKGCRKKCLGTCGWDEYKYVPLDKSVTILIMGGGYFGDLWRGGWQPVMDTITRYPDNPIVILPQSIHYDNEQTASEDASRLDECKNLTICTRDEQSYNYAKSIFCKARTLLVPDLAFHANLTKLRLFSVKESKPALFLKRNDKELPKGISYTPSSLTDVSDWPDMGYESSRVFQKVNRCYEKIRAHKGRFFNCLKTWLMLYAHRNVVLFDAVRFLSRYETIYTTRLHTMILAFMLGKRVFIIDNSYRKVSGCFETWLQGCENVSIYHPL